MHNSRIDKLTKEYRPELNGLRGLAVLLVLFYHLEFEWMKGGFLGVDIFLVISGYFISRNILVDVQLNLFTYSRFYTKRIRRLFPALLLTIILTMAAGYLLFAPGDYQRLGLSSFFSTVSASNFFFWSEAGYFDGSTIAKPLLHMWSLSLEEQFYLIWPFLLVTAFGLYRKRLLFFILTGVLLSLFSAEILFAVDRSAVFYLIPFRMFEFMLGAACIWFERASYAKLNKFKHDFLFSLGLVLMILPSIYFSQHTKLPGFLSLIPCGGAMFVIIGGKKAFLNRLLSNKIVEYIGKASYSIYLVHWPLIVFYTYVTLTDFSIYEQAVLGLLSIGLGFLMWHYIENTFRYPRKKNMKFDPAWIIVLVIVTGICLFSKVTYESGGFVSRFTGELFMSNEELLENRKNYWMETYSNNGILKGELDEGHVIVLGNSHAIDLIYALRFNGFDGKITSLQSGSRCYNFGSPEQKIDSDFCKTRKSQNLKAQEWGQVDAVYVHDDWPILDIPDFRIAIREIKSKTNAPIYVFGPKIRYTENVPDIVRMSKSIVPEVINEYARKYSELATKQKINNALANEFESNIYYHENQIRYIDLLHLQGGKELDEFEIVAPDNLEFLYFDGGHLTQRGSKQLGKRMKTNHPYLFDTKMIMNE